MGVKEIIIIFRRNTITTDEFSFQKSEEISINTFDFKRNGHELVAFGGIFSVEGFRIQDEIKPVI